MQHSYPPAQAAPRLIAWEITRSCNLLCAHCRASANSGHYEGELNTGECFALLDEISGLGRPIIILTGGEPLLREDIFDIARYAAQKGLRVAIGSNGTLVSPDAAAEMAMVPVSRISISLDFPTTQLQDDFRCSPGAYNDAVAGIKNARQAGVEVQINSTITRRNVQYLPDLVSLALELGAVAFHPFLLVPTGRGKGLASEELSPVDYEATLRWIYHKQQELGGSMMFKPTDAPHYYRVAKQCGAVFNNVHGMNAMTRGCLAGTGFCFISHTGVVQGCGYLDIEAGNVRKQSFADIWKDSPLFNSLRDLSLLKGKCGVCEYVSICGGCRARAYESTGDYLAAEPYCAYTPGALRGIRDAYAR